MGAPLWFRFIFYVFRVFHPELCICFFFVLNIYIYISFVFKATFLEYECAINKPKILADGIKYKITMSNLLTSHSIAFNKAELQLSSDKDTGGPCTKTHINPWLNCRESFHTQSSGYFTGRCVVTGACKFLPPLIPFSSSA